MSELVRPPLDRRALGLALTRVANVTRSEEFTAYGDMPALKIFWYDGLKESPKIPGVPEGE